MTQPAAQRLFLFSGESMKIRYRKSLLAANGVKAPRGARRSLKAPEFRRIKARSVTRIRSKRMRNKPESVAPGEFTAHTYGCGAAIRAYKLYVPALHSARPRPLLMMLHGCKQNPDDFAAGTRMNELADLHGFLVAYPAQTSRTNIASCWSWFMPLEQEREGVEPSQLAGIVGAIAETHDIDMGSVFVAGLSAGAAMAVILGETYPEIFAAVGAHSGLPWGAAHNILSAFFAMQGSNPHGTKLRVGSAQARASSATWHGVPTIVFHGDGDRTVAVSNGEAIVQQALHSFPCGKHALQQQAVLPTISTIGHDSTTTRYVDGSGCSRVESWAVHGGTHAWSGGSSEGSYTDPEGPDASVEMVRFFLAACRT
jgi:poly(hydroxyalkanoate) depolymerase family esterase